MSWAAASAPARRWTKFAGSRPTRHSICSVIAVTALFSERSTSRRPARGPLISVYLVRHAKAGDRQAWEGEDRLRPVDQPGWRQAEGLAEAFQGEPLDMILSSPYLRCFQT